MNNINTVTLSGNLTKDATLRNNALQFSVAVNNSRKNAEGEWEDYASFIDCVIFGNRAKALEQYLVKGQKVLISGRLNQSRWEDKDGNPRRAVSVFVNELELVSGKPRKNEPVDSEHIPF